MKKDLLNWLFVTIIVTIYHTGFSQILNQDSRGGTTIMYQGSTINFDVANTSASFAYNHFKNEDFKNKDTNGKHKGGFFGIRMRANSQNGITNLLKTGDFTPDGELGIVFGSSWVKESFNINTTLAPIHTSQNARLKFAQITQNRIENKIKKFSTINTNATVNTQINFIINSFGIGEFPKQLEEYEKNNPSLFTNAVLKAEYEDFIIFCINSSKEIEDFNNEHSTKEIDEIFDKIKRSYWQTRHLIYFNISGLGSEFMYQKDTINKNFSERYEKKNFTGIKIGIGYNLQNGGKEIFGLNAGYEKANNFDLLDDSDITLSSSLSGGIRKIETKKSFTAYSGNYNTYDRAYLNGDYIKFFAGGEKDKSVIVGNIFVRQTFTFDKTIYPDITTIGAGGYFFKNDGTFLGGLFIEVKDVLDNLGRNNFLSSTTPTFNRFVVGIVTKFSIGASIISYSPHN